MLQQEGAGLLSHKDWNRQDRENQRMAGRAPACQGDWPPDHVASDWWDPAPDLLVLSAGGHPWWGWELSVFAVHPQGTHVA